MALTQLAEAYEDFDAWERWMESEPDSELVDWEEMGFAERARLYALFCSWAAKPGREHGNE